MLAQEMMMEKYDFPQYGLAFVSGKIINDHRPVGVMVGIR
jgi:hypothetical protein